MSALGLAAIMVELEALRRHHHVSEDCWYTCPAVNRDPKAAERCCNEAADRGSTECDCGADAANIILDRVIATLKEGLRPVLTDEERMTCGNAGIAASNEVDRLLGIIERLTGERP